jgi:hypothetical protein
MPSDSSTPRERRDLTGTPVFQDAIVVDLDPDDGTFQLEIYSSETGVVWLSPDDARWLRDRLDAFLDGYVRPFPRRSTTEPPA